MHRMNIYLYLIKFIRLQNWRGSQGLNTFPVTGKRFRQLLILLSHIVPVKHPGVHYQKTQETEIERKTIYTF